MKRPALLFFFALFLPCFSPAHADFGCHFIVNQRSATALNEGSRKISFRFTCRNDMNLNAISLYCEEAQTPPGYWVSIRPDDNGKPSEEALGSAGFVPKGGQWITVPLDPTPLSGGKVYHLVVEQDKNRGGEHPVGLIGPKNYASFSYTDFPNQMIPVQEIPDPQEDVLVFENGYWHSLGRQPLYALHGGGFQVQGDPYESSGAFPIFGDTLQGEVLHPHCGVFPVGFALRVKKKGSPSSPLNYRIYKNDFLHHTTTFTYGGKALDPGQVTGAFQWVTFGVKPEDRPVAFPAECYYVVFQSDSGKSAPGEPGCDDCYLLSEAGNGGGLPMAAEMSFDGGAHLSRASCSTDGGKTWTDKFEWDANVLILGPGCPVPTPPSLHPVATPEPLPRSLEP